MHSKAAIFLRIQTPPSATKMESRQLRCVAVRAIAAQGSNWNPWHVPCGMPFYFPWLSLHLNLLPIMHGSTHPCLDSISGTIHRGGASIMPRPRPRYPEGSFTLVTRLLHWDALSEMPDLPGSYRKTCRAFPCCVGGKPMNHRELQPGSS